MINTHQENDIRNLSYEELVRALSEMGEKLFRATQLFEWIYKKGARSFDEMTNIPIELRKKCGERFIMENPTIVREDKSEDQTRKVLFSLKDNERIETVLIPTLGRSTVCISTQAGCKFGCRFCASGIGGWNRNLSAAEILSQILYMKDTQRGQPLSHIVFMGVGEPLATVSLHC